MELLWYGKTKKKFTAFVSETFAYVAMPGLELCIYDYVQDPGWCVHGECCTEESDEPVDYCTDP